MFDKALNITLTSIKISQKETPHGTLGFKRFSEDL